MVDAFVPVIFSSIQPLIEASELVQQMAADASALRAVRGRIASADGLDRHSGDQVSPELQEDVTREPTALVLHLLSSGTLPSYVNTRWTHNWFRVPMGYWVSRSAVESPSSAFSLMQPFECAAGYDNGMTGQPVLLSEQAARVFRQGYADYIAETAHSDVPKSSATDSTDDNGMPHASSPKAIRECTEWLRSEFANADTKARSKSTFKEIATRKKFVGRLSGRGFDSAWKAATADFFERRKSGPRPK